MTPQQVDGMVSNSQWTGVPLRTILREVGVRPGAEWMLAEGGDACLMARSIPVSKANDDAMIAYAQNGEPIRPEQGFPIRLLLPGWEGNANVKWLRRLELAEQPFMTRWETSKYTDPLPNGTARMFSFEMDAKSIITSPAYPERLTAGGWWPISGLAWSGRGRITRVDVSTDGGTTWAAAELLTSLSPKAHVRFQHMWEWNGNPTLLMSRAVDETGYVQPTMAQLRTARGPGTDYHFNSIRGWRVARDGAVTFEANT
jgi:sulfane dehydrogenase subunit SoxC